MSRAEEPRPELPRLLVGRHRPRWKDPPPGADADARPTLVARDTVLDRELELERVPFGAARRGERDALVERLKRRTTVLDPSLVAVHDAGEWEDDAFVLNEPIEAPRALEQTLADTPSPSVAERLRWATELCGAACTLDEAGLSIGARDWDAVVLDGYRAIRVRGLDRASDATDEARAATVRSIGQWLARLAAVEVDEARDREAREALASAAVEAPGLSIAALRARVGALSGAPEPERPLLPNIEAGAGRGSSLPLVVGLSFFVLAFVVLIVVLAAAR
ncbi:MAG: hypothetical protein K1X94_24435 [Sandaracinaceae bacterium]|nr:hypothetical protein [Sandaracinaceae bacterium]